MESGIYENLAQIPQILSGLIAKIDEKCYITLTSQELPVPFHCSKPWLPFGRSQCWTTWANLNYPNLTNKPPWPFCGWLQIFFVLCWSCQHHNLILSIRPYYREWGRPSFSEMGKGGEMGKWGWGGLMPDKETLLLIWFDQIIRFGQMEKSKSYQPPHQHLN